MTHYSLAVVREAFAELFEKFSEILHRIEKKLDRLFHRPAVSGIATLYLERNMADPFPLPDNKTATIKLSFLDAQGFPGGTIDAAATFTTGDPAIVITPDASDLSVYHVSRNGVPAVEPVSIVAHCVGGGNAFDVDCGSVVVTAAGPAVSGVASFSVDA